MTKIENIDKEQLHLYTGSLMLLIASADDVVEESEIKVITDILCDFYKIKKEKANYLLTEAKKINNNSTDLFEAGSYINNLLSLQDKIDFIACIYEVAYADKNMHFLERHIIKQISNILNINKEQHKKIKNEVKKYLL